MLQDKQSFLGQYWIPPDVSDNNVSKVAKNNNIPYILASILVGRQKLSNEDISGFLCDTAIPTPILNFSKIPWVGAFIDKFRHAVSSHKSIGVICDYDADGITSGAILTRYLRSKKITVVNYIPDRLNEGYGPNIEAVDGILKQGVSLCIMLDCGTSATEVIDYALMKNLEVIVVDHHKFDHAVSDKISVLNFHTQDNTEFSSLQDLCTVGLVFVLLWYAESINCNCSLKQMYCVVEKYMGLVAIGTVCDMVPVLRVNRWLVNSGLKYMRNLKFQQKEDLVACAFNLALYKLICNSNLHCDTLGSHDIGFYLGPRINAAGRMGHADVALSLFLSDEEEKIQSLVLQLDEYNMERKIIESQVVAEALNKANAQIQENPHVRCIIVADTAWHIGVLGIVAGVLARKFARPVIVVSWINEIGSASGRSVKGVNLGNSILCAKNAGLLVDGGGHNMAVGFKILQQKFDDFLIFMHNFMCTQDLQLAKHSQVRFDAFMDLANVNLGLYKQLNCLEPYGVDNDPTTVVLTHVYITKLKVHKGKHISCLLMDAAKKKFIKGWFFNHVDSILGNRILHSDNVSRLFHVLGRIQVSRWQDCDYVNFCVLDAMLA